MAQRSTFTIDTKLGGWNMPNANTQMGPLAVDTTQMQAAFERVSRIIDEMVIDASQKVPFSGSDREEYQEQLTNYVRQEIRNELSKVRRHTMRAARRGLKHDRGAMTSAVFRRNYMDEIGGNINISGNGRRMSNGQRPWSPGKILKRDHTDRTRTINRYYGMDRAFILRILEAGRDSYFAESGTGKTGRGSRATWGRRGAMAARGFFTEMAREMDRSADIVARSVERYLERKFN